MSLRRSIQGKFVPWAIVLLFALMGLNGCSGRKGVLNPWGPQGHDSGPIKDPDSLRTALSWGKANAQDAQQILEGLYIVTQKTDHLTNRVRVQTRWSRLALHAAERTRSSQQPDPAFVEQTLQGPPLTVTFMRQGLKKDLVSRIDMVLVQKDQRAYAPDFRRGVARPVKDGERIVAYESDLEGDFPLEGLNPKRAVTLAVRMENGQLLDFDIPLYRLK